MRPTRNQTPIVLSAVVTFAALLALGGGGTAQGQSIAGPFRGNYAGYYYSPGGYNGGYYFNPGYYPNPAASPMTRPVVAAASPARTTYANANSSYNSTPIYRAAVRRQPTYSSADWSTGRTNDPIPLTKPWMMPLRN